LAAFAVRVAAALVAAVAAGCARGPEPWNLLLVTLDTTRADHLGAYGYSHVDSPSLDALAAEGLRYERVTTAAPLTLPSHASILTGLYPPRHGVRANGVYVLADEARTLAEVLREAGYETAAFVGAFVLDKRFGLAQGFDRYDDDLSGGTRPTRYTYAQRDAARVTDATLAWLEQSSEPFFLWVHYFDPHAPYAPPGFDPKAVRVPFRTPYDAEIGFADSQLARLLDSLASAGRDRRTLVAVTADHGEALLEHGEASHGLFAYEATLRVPLIVRFPDRRHAGTVVAAPVSLVDLMPSLLAWLGREVPADLDGRILPVEDEPEARERAIYFENYGPAHLFGWSPLWGVVVDGMKYVHAPRPELYDLGRDPYESGDLYDAAEARSRASRARFEEVMAGLEAASHLAGGSPSLGEADREKLEALGYASGATAFRELFRWQSPPGADPKDRVEVYHDVEIALSLIEQGRAQQGVDLLLQVLSRDPGNRRAVTVLANLIDDETVRPRVVEGLSLALRRGTGDPELDQAVRARLAEAAVRPAEAPAQAAPPPGEAAGPGPPPAEDPRQAAGPPPGEP
jgi:arylsulfatase A-like enzyme